MEVFGSSGVRGLANEELTPAFATRIARAAGGNWRRDADAVAVARDTRTTGWMLADAVASGLASVGLDVRRLGVLATPGAQAYAEREGIPAVVVTASHNPPEYNGLKLVGADGIGLSRDALERVERRLIAEDVEDAAWDAVGQRERVDGAGADYVANLLSSVPDRARERIADADLRVALDPGHGAGALTSPDFLRELGCEVVTVNAQPDGRFPGRDPEPVAANLDDLGRLVQSADADVGVAHDGDADRAIFFDEHGDYLEGDAALAALAAEALSGGDAVVSAVNVSQRLVDVANEAGADLELTPIGSTNIITRIRELLSADRPVPIAGEGNGGILFPDHRLARDGAYTAARFLELVAERPASEVVAAHGGYHNVRLNLGYSGDAEREAMLGAAERYASEADARATTLDGYRLDHGDAWVLARPSGTEPLVRVYAEAGSGERAEDLAHGLRDALLAAVD